MGYRSDVEFIFYPENDEHFPVMKLWIDENMPDIVDGGAVYDGAPSPYIHYRATDMKWYEGYADVDAVMKAIDRFNDLFCGEDATIPCNYEYVRIGEEYEDIETRFSDNARFRIYVRREVVVD